jgi:hypothetical protein
MRKTTVYLSEEEAEALRRGAARLGMSQSELIREGVRRITSGGPRSEFRSRGIVASGGPDLDAGTYLREHWIRDLQAEARGADA